MILKTKLKNMVNFYTRRTNSFYVFSLNNIVINGEKRGCSGFISNLSNGVTVYVNTEKSVYAPMENLNLYRFAKNDKDYGGVHSRNCYAEDLILGQSIHEMLQDKKAYQEWLEKTKRD